MVSEVELGYLRHCVELARQALEAGDAPFGSVLVNADGEVLKEERNRTVTESNVSLHPEFTLAIWAQRNLPSQTRATATVYTSGEHCPMCSAVHANVGLGKIVYASSSKQLAQWKQELSFKPGPVNPLPITQVAPGLKVEGPVDSLAEEIRELHRRHARLSQIS
jgi:tRNA(Arg) A34 adenosine deaminase TadA